MILRNFALYLAITPAFALAQESDMCMRQFQAEQMRIEAEMARQVPPKGDREAEARWAKNLHAALQLAGRNAEQCRRRTSPAPSETAIQAEQDCAAKVRKAGEDLMNRYRGKTLSSSEQSVRRAEEMTLDEQMHQCRLARRR